MFYRVFYNVTPKLLLLYTCLRECSAVNWKSQNEIESWLWNFTFKPNDFKISSCIIYKIVVFDIIDMCFCHRNYSLNIHSWQPFWSAKWQNICTLINTWGKDNFRKELGWITILAKLLLHICWSNNCFFDSNVYLLFRLWKGILFLNF